MIAICHIGGLGNQMFQYATARVVAHCHNRRLKLDVTAFEEYRPWPYYLGRFSIIENLATGMNYIVFEGHGAREQSLTTMASLVSSPSKKQGLMLSRSSFGWGPSVSIASSVQFHSRRRTRGTANLRSNVSHDLAKKMLFVNWQGHWREYGFNGIYLLPVNLYGPGGNNDLVTSHVIPAMIRKFKEAKEQNLPSVTLWGGGSPTREFLYVEDAAEGIVLATERYDKPEPVNLGSGQEISIKDLAKLIKQLIGYQGAIIWDTTKPNGQPRRLLDVSRAEREFGFKAQASLETKLSLLANSGQP